MILMVLLVNTAVAATKVSALQGEATVTYGGLEDD